MKSCNLKRKKIKNKKSMDNEDEKLLLNEY